MSWVELEPDFGPTELVTAETGEMSFSALFAMTFTKTDELKVFVAAEARQNFEEHMAAHKVETGGLLVGRVLISPIGGMICFIEQAVPSQEFDGTGVSLVMGSCVWDEARAFTDGDLGVIGWFHSHPNLGAFFSGTDRRTQRDFFAQRYSLGLVRDPIRQEEKWFGGPESDPVDATNVLLLS